MPRHRITILAATTSLCLSFLGPVLRAQLPAASSAVTGVVAADLLGLVTNPAVQAELKVTEEQTAQLKALSEKDDGLRLRWLERMGMARPDGAGIRGDGQTRGASDQADQPRRSGRRKGGQAAQTGRADRIGGNSNGTGGGHGPGYAADAELQVPFAAMVESRMEIQQSTERSIARILSRPQYARARQIQLQVEGPDVLLRPAMQERLNLNEDQLVQLRELMLEHRQALRETRDARNALKEAALDRDPALSRLKLERAPNVRPVQRGVRNEGGQDVGNVPTNRPENDPAYIQARNQARRKLGEDRELQNQMSAFRARDETIEKQLHAALHTKILTRRQSQTYKKMLGAPFVLSPGAGVAQEGAGGSGPGENRSGTLRAERPASARGARAAAASSEKKRASPPTSQATVNPGS